jgi:hypothetical protein
MIKEISEAICESIGSLMDTHSTRNCDLGPENFSNDIILRVNLAALHLMGNLIDEILALDNEKLYVRIEKKLKTTSPQR